MPLMLKIKSKEIIIWSQFLDQQDAFFYGLPASYEYSKNGNWSFFYRFSSLNEKKNFEEANQICRNEGAFLPIPRTGT